MTAKDMLECRIKEIEKSEISDKNKKVLIKIFREIWPDYYDKNISSAYPMYLCFPCNRNDFFMNIPEWLCSILGVIKKKNKNYFSYGYEYDVWFPMDLVVPHFNFSDMINCIEDTESIHVLNMKKSNYLSEKKSLEELKSMKKKLECELGIVIKAINIKEKENSDSKQKLYRK